jgi:hypothetical protein
MSDRATEHTPTDLLQTVSEFLVGGGVLTMALFPLAIPVIALLIVAALPLLVLAAAVALIGAVLAAPIVLIRGVVRKLGTVRINRRERESAVLRGSRPAMGARG